MSTNETSGGVTFDIVEHIGVLATFATGWRKEINYVSWNGAPAKYDIREWDPSHSQMSRGLTLKENEMRLLLELMRRRRRPYGVTQPDSFDAIKTAPVEDTEEHVSVTSIDELDTLDVHDEIQEENVV